MRACPSARSTAAPSCSPPSCATGVDEAQQGGYDGQPVRWGGRIVKSTPGPEQTCIEVVSLPLDAQTRPREIDATTGRFVACGSGFYDPAIYAADRDVTVVGTLDGSQQGKVGDLDYRYPRVAAETIYLWPQPQSYPYYYGGGPYWYPYAWGYPYGWGYPYPWGFYGGGVGFVYRGGRRW
jgi:outer membrane lipoprotein